MISKFSRREAVKTSVAAMFAAITGGLFPYTRVLEAHSRAEHDASEHGPQSANAFVYTELQITIPFENVHWQDVNKKLMQIPGLINKTWFSGVGDESLGGFYAFDSIEHAQRFVNGYYPPMAKSLGVSQTSRIFDAIVVEEASRDMGSPLFGVSPTRNPGAFVYTEVQLNISFKNAPWRKRNPVPKQQPGLLSKTWLSGYMTNTLGGVDVFDSVENAKRFALEDFPETAKRMSAAFCTRMFDGNAVAEASRQMRSPFFV